ncbi:MAG: hypothetical protein ACK5L7_00985 [Paludibacteraceae bacterium]
MFSQINSNGQSDKTAITATNINAIPEPAPYNGELQSFYRSKSSAKYKLEDYTAELDKAQSRFDRMSLDWNNLQGRIKNGLTVLLPTLLNWTAYRPMRI